MASDEIQIGLNRILWTPVFKMCSGKFRCNDGPGAQKPVSLESVLLWVGVILRIFSLKDETQHFQLYLA